VIAVTLNDQEVAWACYIARQRHESCLKKGIADKYGATGGYSLDEQGALGEYAVAKALGVQWTPGVDTFSAEGGDGVGKFEVRTGGRHNYSLIIRPADKDERVFILATTEDRRTFFVHGWMTAIGAKRVASWKRAPNGRPPAWFVPQGALIDLRFLPRPVQNGRAA
jgi:hypothetical protein